LTEYPEVNLAQRVLEKFRLRPPVDIFALVAQYAYIDVVRVPFDIDGVSYNLKILGKRPIVILNDSRPLTRKRFTLAHELGHVLIPWHIGTIVDEIDISEHHNDLSYWELENEANRFAAELLMPRRWVTELARIFENPGEVVERVTEGAKVSIDAAIIQVKQVLKPGYVYALVDNNGVVVSSGRTPGTFANLPGKGSYLDRASVFRGIEARWELPARDGVWHWWRFANEVNLPRSSDMRDWREILEDILSDLGFDRNTWLEEKQRINGIVGNVNGMLRRDPDRDNTPEALYAVCMQRFHSRALDSPVIRECLDHPDFPVYLAKRVKAFGEK
jgi:hypothetical protein